MLAPAPMEGPGAAGDGPAESGTSEWDQQHATHTDSRGAQCCGAGCRQAWEVLGVGGGRQLLGRQALVAEGAGGSLPVGVGMGG